MKTLYTFGVLLLGAYLSGCVAPTNLEYDSARMLSTKEVDVTASYSNYLLYAYADSNNNRLQENAALRLSYGVNEQYNVSLRYERASTNISFNTDLISFDGAFGYNYFEVNNKLSLKQDKIALSMPIGAYQFLGNENASDLVYVFDPRLMFTIPLKEEKFNLTITPKAHFFIGDVFAGWPGLTIGSEMSGDLSRWAIHPSIGFDGFFSAGVGFRYGIIRN